MNVTKKELVSHHICRNHSARSDREFFRICPSKLSKKELEDVYYTVLENNVELKRTVNTQQDRITQLSARVQRLSVSQKSTIVKDKRDCCTYTKSIVNDQKDCIAELKKANASLSERIQVLTMRLCSAKQFLRRSPAPPVSRCLKCSATAMSVKNSLSFPNSKRSETNLKSAAVSIQSLNDNMASARSVEFVSDDNKREKPCHENKCRTQVDELKQKIIDLQEESNKALAQHAARTAQLERELSEQRAARARADHALQRGARRHQRALHSLRAAEAQFHDLSTQLAIEKKKVFELDTRMKAVDMSRMVAQAIEDHLRAQNQMKSEMDNLQTSPSSFTSPRWDKSSSRNEVSGSRGLEEIGDKPDRASKLSDDSGFMDPNKSRDTDDDKEKTVRSSNLVDKIKSLQDQLTFLKMTATMGGAAGPQHHQPVSTVSKQLDADNKLPYDLDNDSWDDGNQPPNMSTPLPTRGDSEAILKSDCESTAQSLVTALSNENKSSLIDDLQLDQSVGSTKLTSTVKNNVSEISDNKKHLNEKRKSVDSTPENNKANIKYDKRNSLQIPGSQPDDDVDDHKNGKNVTINTVVKLNQLLNKNSDKKVKKKNSIDTIADKIETIDGKDKNKTNDLIEKETEALNADDSVVNIQNTNKELVQTNAKQCKLKIPIISANVENIDKNTTKTTELNLIDAEKKTQVAESVNQNVNNKAKGDQVAGNTPPSSPEGARRRSLTFTKGGTYSLPASPDNTDLEISSMTDLPSERDGKPDHELLSPGEHRTTPSYSDTYSAPSGTEFGALSEGELPTATGDNHMSDGETNANAHVIKSNSEGGQLSPRGLQAAVRAVSHELHLCRALLHSRRPARLPHQSSVP